MRIRAGLLRAGTGTGFGRLGGEWHQIVTWEAHQAPASEVEFPSGQLGAGVSNESVLAKWAPAGDVRLLRMYACCGLGDEARARLCLQRAMCTGCWRADLSRASRKTPRGVQHPVLRASEGWSATMTTTMSACLPLRSGILPPPGHEWSGKELCERASKSCKRLRSVSETTWCEKRMGTGWLWFKDAALSTSQHRQCQGRLRGLFSINTKLTFHLCVSRGLSSVLTPSVTQWRSSTWRSSFFNVCELILRVRSQGSAQAFRANRD